MTRRIIIIALAVVALAGCRLPDNSDKQIFRYNESAGITSLDPAYAQAFLQNGQYWHLIIYSGCVAGCLLPIGNVGGFTLMKAEDVSIAWYTRHIMPKVLLGWGLGLGVYFLVDLWLR